MSHLWVTRNPTREEEGELENLVGVKEFLPQTAVTRVKEMSNSTACMARQPQFTTSILCNAAIQGHRSLPDPAPPFCYSALGSRMTSANPTYFPPRGAIRGPTPVSARGRSWEDVPPLVRQV